MRKLANYLSYQKQGITLGIPTGQFFEAIPYLHVDYAGRFCTSADIVRDRPKVVRHMYVRRSATLHAHWMTFGLGSWGIRQKIGDCAYMPLRKGGGFLQGCWTGSCHKALITLLYRYSAYTGRRKVDFVAKVVNLTSIPHFD